MPGGARGRAGVVSVRASRPRGWCFRLRASSLTGVEATYGGTCQRSSSLNELDWVGRLGGGWRLVLGIHDEQRRSRRDTAG